jgi:hypothetical protein
LRDVARDRSRWERLPPGGAAGSHSLGGRRFRSPGTDDPAVPPWASTHQRSRRRGAGCRWPPRSPAPRLLDLAGGWFRWAAIASQRAPIFDPACGAGLRVGPPRHRYGGRTAATHSRRASSALNEPSVPWSPASRSARYAAAQSPGSSSLQLAPAWKTPRRQSRRCGNPSAQPADIGGSVHLERARSDNGASPRRVGRRPAAEAAAPLGESGAAIAVISVQRPSRVSPSRKAAGYTLPRSHRRLGLGKPSPDQRESIEHKGDRIVRGQHPERFKRRLPTGAETDARRILRGAGLFARREAGPVETAGPEPRARGALALMPSAIPQARALAARQSIWMAPRERQPRD